MPNKHRVLDDAYQLKEETWLNWRRVARWQTLTP